MAFDIEAHRGGRALLPENTLPAFANALTMGVDTLEMDLGVSLDGAIVISHERGLNPDLARGADGAYVAPPGIPFIELRLSDIKKYDVGQLRPNSAYAAQFPDQRALPGTPIPTLKEVLALVRQSGDRHVRLNIETKIDPDPSRRDRGPATLRHAAARSSRGREIQRPRRGAVVRLAHAATGAATGPGDPDGLPDPAEGVDADGISRQALGLDRGLRSGRARRLAAACDQGGGRRDLVAVFRRCRFSR